MNISITGDDKWFRKFGTLTEGSLLAYAAERDIEAAKREQKRAARAAAALRKEIVAKSASARVSSSPLKELEKNTREWVRAFFLAFPSSA